ncbi:MAG: hypothetical protein JXR86_06030 [Spirochaetales bacterium]|nr:hypothetical protein [Spirochaetales bacterium]
METALELSSYGEEIYSLISDFFDYRPPRIYVYINSRVDSPNGNFYPLPGSIVLYPVYPLGSENTTKSSSWLYELLLHEMVHYVQLEKPIGIFGGLSRILGKDLASANGAFLPAWMVEGIAVYLESKHTAGGRGNNLYFQAFTKAAAWERKYPAVNQLAYSSDFPPYNRIYSYGYILTEYLMRTYGEDIMNRIYSRYVRFPLLGPFHAIKKETGRNLSEIYGNMIAAEKEKYISAFSEASPYSSKKISPAGEIIGDRIHPVPTDRGTILYRRDQQSPPALILIDNEGGETLILETGLTEGSSFSADLMGETLVFAAPDYSMYHSYGYSLVSDLFILKGGTTEKLTKGESLYQPAISPSGDHITAVQRRGSYTRLVSVDKENGSVSVLFERQNTNVMNPVFSPKGDELVFTLNEKGQQDIWLLKLADPSSAAPLFGQTEDMAYHPRFTDRGDITFISDRDGSLSLYLHEKERNRTTLIFKDPVGVADAYLKKGKVFYQAYRTKGYGFLEGAPREGQTVAFGAETTAETSGADTADWSPEISRHRDLALPYLWLPRPFVENSQSEGLIWGAGAAVFAGSVSQSTTWQLNLGFFPGPLQLTGSLEYSRKIGKAALSYSIEQNYKEYVVNSETLWNQSTDQTLLFSYPLLESGTLNYRQVLQNYVYGNHRLSTFDKTPFSFVDGFKLDNVHFLYGGAGISHDFFRINNARSALFGGSGIHNQLDLSILLPLLSADRTSLIVRESGNASLSLSQRGTRWKTDWQAAWHNGGYASSAVKARGWTAEYSASDFSFYYSTSLQVPIALVDWGMPLGVNIQNLAFALNLEGISHVQIEGPEYNRFYGSLEFIGTYGYNYGATPFGAGVSFRFYNDGFNFDPAADIALYFFLSFNS